MDTYGHGMIKKATHLRRSQGTKSIFISSLSQAMPKPSDWWAFFTSSENKTELITFLLNYYRSKNKSIPQKCPLSINNGKATWKTSSNVCGRLSDSNHHEADRRVAYFASISKCFNIQKQCYCLCHCHRHKCIASFCIVVLVKPTIIWQMRISTDLYICIRSIATHYDDKASVILLAFHSMTRYDTLIHLVFKR